MSALVNKNTLRDQHDWPAPPAAIAAFHRRMPAYSPTLLLDAPGLATQLGLGRLLIRAETRRMGLPSFKMLGASWATYQEICAHLGEEPAPWNNINELAANLAHLKPFALATATDGNHGRAISFMARLLGFEARIFVPSGMAAARIAAMEAEGASVTVVDGDYDDAVARSGEEASDRCLVVSDTSWDDYETIPAQVVEGYATIFGEVDDAIEASALAHPDLVVVPMGVGAFMAAAVTHYRSGRRRPTIVGVEPRDANCIQASAMAGEITHVPGPHRSIMVGLNCGLPSMVAWPRLGSGIDWFVSVEDPAATPASARSHILLRAASCPDPDPWPDPWPCPTYEAQAGSAQPAPGADAASGFLPPCPEPCVDYAHRIDQDSRYYPWDCPDPCGYPQANPDAAEALHPVWCPPPYPCPVDTLTENETLCPHPWPDPPANDQAASDAASETASEAMSTDVANAETSAPSPGSTAAAEPAVTAYLSISNRVRRAAHQVVALLFG